MEFPRWLKLEMPWKYSSALNELALLVYQKLREIYREGLSAPTPVSELFPLSEAIPHLSIYQPHAETY